MKWPWVNRLAFDLLHTECERLRAENRALMNAVLVTTGHKPIERSGEPAEPVKRKARPSWFQWGHKMTAESIKQAREVKPNGSVSEAKSQAA